MKTNLKNLTFFLFIIFTLGELKSQETSSSQDKYPETVLIRLYEPMYYVIPGSSASKLVTILPDNSVETKELVSVNIKKEFDPPIEPNLVKIRIELQAWHNKGFEVKSMSSTSAGENGLLMITTIILTKN